VKKSVGLQLKSSSPVGMKNNNFNESEADMVYQKK